MVSNVLVHRTPDEIATKRERDGKFNSRTSLTSDPIEQVKALDMSTRGSVYSDSGISCTSSRNKSSVQPRGEDELRHINKVYDSYDTASVRSHATSRSTSTYRSAGDISASVSTFKPFLFNTNSDCKELNLEDGNPFEKFVEVLISTQMAETKGKEAVPNGFQNDAHLWAIFTSSRLNLKIPPDQVRTMRDWFYAAEHENPDLNKEFISGVRDLITQLSRERPLYGPPWVSVVDHTSRELFFNRVTGEARYGVPKDFPTLSEMDVFGRTIHEMFYSVTPRGVNHITLPQFDEICQSKKYSIELKVEEKSKLVRSIVKTLNEEEVIYYEDFVPVGRSLLLKWYRQQYPKGGDWLKLSSKRYGFFYLNKMTGETTFRPAQYEREQLAMYLQDTLKQVETLKDSARAQEEESRSTRLNLEDKTKENKEKSEEVDALKTQIKKLEDHIATEKGNHEILLEKYDSAARDLDESKLEVQTWLGANSLMQEQKSSVEADMQEKTRQVERNEKIIEDLYGDIHHLRDDINKSTVLAAAKESDYTAMQNKCEEQRKALYKMEQTLAKEKEKLTNEVNELQSKLLAEEDNNKSLANSGASLQSNITDLSKAKKLLEEDIAKLKDNMDEEKETRKKLILINETLKKRNEIMDADLQTFKEQHLTANNKELSEALAVIENLKKQLGYQKEEVKTLRIKHSSKTLVFAQQSEDVFALREQLRVLEERNAKHADVLKDAVLKAGKLMRKVFAREGAPYALKRVQSCPELDKPFPSGRRLEPTQKRKAKQCWDRNFSTPKPPPNICRALSPATGDCGDIAMCTREREKVLVMRDHGTVAVTSLRSPRNDYQLQTPPYSPTCTCENCKSSDRSSSVRSRSTSSNSKEIADTFLPIKIGDRVRCRTLRPGYTDTRVLEGVVEFLGKRRGYGKSIFVGINIGVPLGDTDGSIDGERLFRCAPKHGVVVALQNVLAFYSPKHQTFVPLLLPGAPMKKGYKGFRNNKRRPKSETLSVTCGNNAVTTKNWTFSTISVDERYVRSPYLKSLIAVDPYSPEFKAEYGAKPRVPRPIARQKSKNENRA